MPVRSADQAAMREEEPAGTVVARLAYEPALTAGRVTSIIAVRRALNFRCMRFCSFQSKDMSHYA